MERETKTIETPVGKNKLVIYTYLLGGDKRRLISEPDPIKSQNIAINALVVSIDEKTENHIKSIEEMHGKDFDFVTIELAKVMNESSWDEDKKKE